MVFISIHFFLKHDFYEKKKNLILKEVIFFNRNGYEDLGFLIHTFPESITPCSHCCYFWALKFGRHFKVKVLSPFSGPKCDSSILIQGGGEDPNLPKKNGNK